jgi:ubiquinone/menaquinone biosynthesis C-methylase UbiE
MGLIFDIEFARRYESWSRSARGRAMDRFVEKAIYELLDPRPNERVLDIGCGSGNHLLFFNKLGIDINGVDASPYMIDIARRRLGHRCTLRRCMAEDLPFDDNEFDLAVLINTLEFLDDPLKALREAGRVAKRKVFICVINSLSWRCMIDRLQGLISENVSRHIVPYHIWELKSYVRKAYGPIPVAWRSEGHGAFGTFLGLSATMEYRVITDNLLLKLSMGKKEQPLEDGLTTSRMFPKWDCDRRPTPGPHSSLCYGAGGEKGPLYHK